MSFANIEKNQQFPNKFEYILFTDIVKPFVFFRGKVHKVHKESMIN